jgi:hypothetical protein
MYLKAQKVMGFSLPELKVSQGALDAEFQKSFHVLSIEKNSAPVSLKLPLQLAVYNKRRLSSWDLVQRRPWPLLKDFTKVRI